MKHVNITKLDATQAALRFPDDPNIVRYTVFDPKNVYRSPHEVAEIHKATGLSILPKGNVLQPENGNIGVELISFRPERIAQQLTMASINMQAQIDEESFSVIVDDVFKSHVAKEMEGVIPKVEAVRKKIESEVQMALEILNKTPDMNLDGVSQTIKKVKEAKDLVQSKIDSGEYKPESPEVANDAISKYATDLIYNDSKEVFGLIEEAVDRGMQQALKAGSYKPLPTGPNSERVAIVVAGGPASGKTQATQMALESVPENQAMSFSTDQLRTLVSPEGGPPSFTDQEANLVFRQVIGKVDKAMNQDRAPTILSEGTGLNPGAISHLLTGEGTKVDAYLISIPAEKALKRASSRAESKEAKDQGRSYSDEYLLGLHKQDGVTLLNVGDQLKGKNVKLSILDNDVAKGEDPKVVAEIDFKTGKMSVYNIEALAKIEQKAKLDPKQQKDQGMYDATDKLPENNMSFLTKVLKDFEITFKDGKEGKKYASSKPDEKLHISDQELFDAKKKQNPYDNLLEKTKNSAMGIDRKEILEEKRGLEKKSPTQKTSLEALDLAKPEEKESKEMPKEESWVEKIADRKLSTSRDGHREI
jgi:hypothetical protein